MKFFKTSFCLTFFVLVCQHAIASYFQQEVNYIIHVSLNDVSHELSADERIVYKNNSGDTLNELYFHLWPAAYEDRYTVLGKEIFKSGDTRMMDLKESDFGNIDSLDFMVDGSQVHWETLKDTIDICRIKLNKALYPGDSIIITTPFHVKIPSADISRLGHIGQAYFITQWFPKPAVYDLNGWNYFPYLDQGEYYSEFGSFDVYVTLPENYIIAATGNMIDANKEYAWLSKKDSITRTITKFPERDSVIASSSQLKTIHFSQNNIHDFAWFADKRWHVLKEEIKLPASGRTVTTWSLFYNGQAELWLRAPEYNRDGINFYSKVVGEYPYDNFTALDCGSAFGSGMEYPMITMIGYSSDPIDHEITIVHEIGHNWFYGILGSNERCHPWMDEGVNNFYETRYIYTKYAADSSKQVERMYMVGIESLLSIKYVNHRWKQLVGYRAVARTNSDQSPDLCSEKLSNRNYNRTVYGKPSISLDYLKSFLGDSLFDLCMHDYFQLWKFKHPQPDDMQNVFEKRSGQKLDWIFVDLMRTTKKLDYKICAIHRDDSTHFTLTIKNSGQVKSPLPVSSIRNQKVIETKWINGFEGTQRIEMNCNDCDAFRIDPEERLPELSANNNSIRVRGILKKTEKINLSAGTRFEDPMKTQIFFLPVIGFNNYNKCMAGVVLHNISFIEKKLEYEIMPLYGFGTRDLAGGGNISYHAYPKNSWINKITFRSGISRYAFAHNEYETLNKDFFYSSDLHFTKLDSKIIFSAPAKDRQRYIKNELTLRNIYIERDIPYQIYYAAVKKNFVYWQAEFQRINSNPLEKSLQRLSITGNNEFVNISGEEKNFLTYGQPNKGFSFRAFAGFTSISENVSSGMDYRMNLCGRDGSGDYLFDEVFIGRSESTGILSHQFVSDYAGFKTPVSFFRLSQKWMVGVNASTTLPGIFPFRLFANVGTFDNADFDGRFGKISWEIGIDLPLIKDIFVIYLPFAYSGDIKYAVEKLNLNAGDMIRFELHLNQLNPVELIKKVYGE